MTITAKFAGKCRGCTKPIAIGERIEWTKNNGAMHQACIAIKTAVQPKAPQRPEAACKMGRDRYKYRAGDQTCCCTTGAHIEHVTYPSGPDGERVATCYHCKSAVTDSVAPDGAVAYYNTFHQEWGEWVPEKGRNYFVRLDGDGRYTQTDGQARVVSLGYGSMSNAYATPEKVAEVITKVLGWDMTDEARARLRAALCVVKAPCVFSRNEDHIVVEAK